MSLSEFESIFENAAGIVRIRCKGMAGLELVLESIRGRIRSSDSSDPRANRDLFFEPWIDAQQLGVPEGTTEAVGRQLLELTVLRLWTRVKCPKPPANEDGIIAETDSDEILKHLFDGFCPHCGITHSKSEVAIESVYAPNFPGAGGMTKFDSNHLALVPQMGTTAQQDAHLARFESIAHVKTGGGQSIVDIAVLALDHNSSPEHVPSPRDAWLNAWLGPAVVLVLYLLLIIPITRFAGPWIALLASVVVTLVIYFVISGQVREKLAPSALQRSVTRWGIYVTVFLVGAGTTGVELTLNEESKLRVPLGGNESIALPIKFEYGSVNNWLVGLGVACFLCTLLFVLVYDQKIGWLVKGD